MSGFFDKNEMNEKNSIPKTEGEKNAYTENSKDYVQAFENKKESKEDDGFLYRQDQEKSDEKEAPSDAYKGTQADNEAEKDREEAQNDSEKIWGSSDILTDTQKKKKRKRNIGIGLAAIIIAIAIAVTTLGGALVMVAVDTALLAWDVMDEVFDVFIIRQDTGTTLPDESDDDQPITGNGTPSGLLSVGELEFDTSDTSNELSVAKVVENTKETVVLISVVGYDYFGRQTTGTGSGVVITEDGYIITNNHVVEGAAKVSVDVPNKGKFEATVIGLDRAYDIALLHINTTGLEYATLGDSDALVMGQEVVALGYPLGSAQTVTAGLVSALNVNVRVEGVSMSLLRTNAAINPGNSGGGLFDRSGRLIGIVNAKQVDTDIEGLGYAIPINAAVESVGRINDAVSNK